jgi:hypothetical protein
MHAATYASFKEELGLIKQSSNYLHAAELGGLGILAAPNVASMAGKKMSEKNKNRAEVAGLGVLAAPSAVALAKNVGKRVGSAVAKHASVTEGALSLFNKEAAKRKKAGIPIPKIGIGAMGKQMASDAWKAAKGTAAGAGAAVRQAATKMPTQAQHAQRAASLGGFMPKSQVNMSRAIDL